MKIDVTDGDGKKLGQIWSTGPATILADPPNLIQLTRRFLETMDPGADADDVLASMDGWSNGYTCTTLVD